MSDDSSTPFFDEVTGPIPFAGPGSADPLSFRFYDAERMIAGRSMREHLRIAVCYWHSFGWPGSDVFGAGTLDRPWLTSTDPMEGARQKLRVAFEFFEKLGAPYYCFHDVDLAPDQECFAAFERGFRELEDLAAAEMQRTGVQLLWGTANLFSHPDMPLGRRPTRTRRSSPEPPHRSPPAWM